MKYNSTKFTSLLLLAHVFLFSSNGVLAYDKAEHQECKNTAAGLYIGNIPGRTTFSMSNTPLNKSHNKMLIVIDTTGDADPTSGGLVPTAVGQSHPRGILIRNSSKESTYEGQLVRYRYNNVGDVVNTEIQGVRMELIDCKTVEIFFVANAYYFSFVNTGMDELPTPDINVDVSGFPPFTAKLINVTHKF